MLDLFSIETFGYETYFYDGTDYEIDKSTITLSENIYSNNYESSVILSTTNMLIVKNESITNSNL